MIALRFVVALWLLATASPPTLTNEDVVRMVAAGKSEREIVATIGTSAESFDVSDDMVDELKRAGVSEMIVGAMRRRHEEHNPAAPPEDRPARGHQHLVVTLNGGLSSHTLKLPAFADEDLKARLSLPKENDQRVVKDVAIFLACASPEHVPDLWRSKTPLGRDMVSVQRHQMLAFVPGDTPPGEKPRMTVPKRLEADVAEAEVHDIVLGVAALIGDRWMQLSAAKLKNVSVAADSKPLAGRVEHLGHAFDVKIELTVPR
jgi:hypothetical protein